MISRIFSFGLVSHIETKVPSIIAFILHFAYVIVIADWFCFFNKKHWISVGWISRNMTL
jgi:hypothetical protein